MKITVFALLLALGLMAAETVKTPSDTALAKLWRLVAARNGQQAAFQESLTAKQKQMLESVTQLDTAIADARTAACESDATLDDQGARCIAKAPVPAAKPAATK